MDLQSEMRRSPASKVSGHDPSIDQGKVANHQDIRELDRAATATDLESAAGARPGEGSVLYRIIALVAMLILAVAAIVFWYYSR